MIAARRKVCVLGVLMSAMSCSSPAPVQAQAASSDEAVGRAVEAQMRTKYRGDGPGAVVLVARGDHVIYRGARGLADVGRGLPLSTDQALLLGSVTKQLVAVGVLKLVASGRLSLDSDIAAFVPDYPNGTQITIRDLLGHTSGIRSYTDIPAVVGERIWKDATFAEIIDSFKDAAPVFEPGQGFAYSNSNYVLAAAVIESVEGKPWYDYLQSSLFDPLQMMHTSCSPRSDPATPGVHGYTVDHDEVVGATPMNMTWAGGAAGCSSTVDDLLKWNRALHHGRLLDGELYRTMVTPSDIKDGSEYGLGVQIAKDHGQMAYGHDGVINGFMASMLYVPATDVFAVVLENSDGGEFGESPTALVRTVIALVRPDPSAVAR